MTKQIYTYIVVLIILAGCGTKKKVSQTANQPEPVVSAWHTCLIRNAQASIQMSGNKVSANITMQAVRDSLVVISVMPMLGIEMVRIEATPAEVTCIDKINGQYAVATYDVINKHITPKLTWKTLQEICSAELPNTTEKARLQYAFKKEVIEIQIQYTERQLDNHIRIQKQPTHKYKQIDITQWF